MTVTEADPPVRPASRRRTAGVAAVQTLYQAEVVHKPLKGAAEEMRQHYIGGAVDDMSLVADRRFFDLIVTAVDENGEKLIALIQGALDTRRLERMELVLQSILVAGAAELLAISEAPPKVTISEYVDIADDFFGKSEASLVNATLDRIGHLVRPDEF
jgi:N utilization substance protein B